MRVRVALSICAVVIAASSNASAADVSTASGEFVQLDALRNPIAGSEHRFALAVVAFDEGSHFSARGHLRITGPSLTLDGPCTGFEDPRYYRPEPWVYFSGIGRITDDSGVPRDGGWYIRVDPNEPQTFEVGYYFIGDTQVTWGHVFTAADGRLEWGFAN